MNQETEKCSQKKIIQEKRNLFEKMRSGEATTHELVRLALLMKMISNKEYEEFLEIEKFCKEHS